MCLWKIVAGISQRCHCYNKVHKLVRELPIVSLADSAALFVSSDTEADLILMTGPCCLPFESYHTEELSKYLSIVLVTEKRVV